MEQWAARRELAGLVRSVHGGGAGMDRAPEVTDCLLVSRRDCGLSLQKTTSKRKRKLKENQMTIQKKQLKISHTYRSDSAQARKPALRGLMQRLGLTLLACTLVLGVTG